MARIVGIDLPREKRVVIGLTYIYGIGRPSAEKIVADAGVNPEDVYKRQDRGCPYCDDSLY